MDEENYSQEYGEYLPGYSDEYGEYGTDSSDEGILYRKVFEKEIIEFCLESLGNVLGNCLSGYTFIEELATCIGNFNFIYRNIVRS